MSCSLVYLLLLCLSLHASSARHLGVADNKENHKGTFHLFGKAVKKEKVHKTLMPSTAMQDNVVGTSRDVTRIFHESWDGANHIKNEHNKAVGLAGNDQVLESTSREDQQEAARIEEWKRQLARRMLGSTSSNAEETINSKENDSPEDVVVMDYAQPHRKPPIHNLEP